MSHPLRWLALVPLERAALPAFPEIAAWFAMKFPQAPPLSVSATTENLLTLTIGDFTAVTSLVPRPIPSSQLEGPIATAWHWPDAAEALSDHSAHLLVALVDEAGAAVAKASLLTQLTAALVATSPAVGVFWGTSRTLHAPGAFVHQALQLTEDNLPLFIWIDFRIEPVGAGAARLFTTGLDAFGQPELECPHFTGPPQELLDYAYNFAHYLLLQRKVIRDGDTIGLTDEVQVTVHRSPSMLDAALEVLRLDFAGPGA